MLSQNDITKMRVIRGEVFNYRYGTYRVIKHDGEPSSVCTVMLHSTKGHMIMQEYHANIDKITDGGISVFCTVIGDIFKGKFNFSEIELIDNNDQPLQILRDIHDETDCQQGNCERCDEDKLRKSA